MTLDEFKAWLDGYTEAGGTDINRVRQKLNEATTPPPLYPFEPIKIIPYPQTYPWTVTYDTNTAGCKVIAGMGA